MKPSTQFLFKDGYWIDSDDYKLSDFLENKDEIVLSLGTAAPITSIKNSSANPQWVINGTKNYFTPHNLEPEEITLIKLKSQYFGLVHHMTGETPGTREFQVKRFSVKQSDKVELKLTRENKIDVYINGNITELEHTVYKETKNKGVKTELSKIAFYIRELKTFISNWVSKGRRGEFFLTFKIFHFHVFAEKPNEVPLVTIEPDEDTLELNEASNAY